MGRNNEVFESIIDADNFIIGLVELFESDAIKFALLLLAKQNMNGRIITKLVCEHSGCFEKERSARKPSKTFT